MSVTYAKPLPVPSAESRPFWDAVRQHELKLQRCEACRAFWFPPSNICPECLSDRWAWTPVSGRGTVFSFVVMRRVYHPGFKDDVPYNATLVALEEGPRLMSNVVDCSNDEIQVGMPVEVVFDDVTDGVTLPKFRPLRNGR